MRTILILLLCISTTPAFAQVMFGTATAVDGDTLDIGTERVRLHAIDAVEARQTCTRDDQDWACGEEAKQFLAELVAGDPLQCREVERDRYGRMVAICTAGRRDLGQMMVDAGYAVALGQYSAAYVPVEEHARNRKAGIWNSQFVAPADFRAAHPHLIHPPVNPKAPPAPTVIRLPSGGAASGAGVWFRNCKAARAAGAAPLYRGQPGYRAPLDADGDGIACEPYRGR